MLGDSKVYPHYERCHGELYGQHSYLLGRILTVVDAAIADPQQRKAIKDLMKGEFNESWNDGFREHLVCAFRAMARTIGDPFADSGDMVQAGPGKEVINSLE